MANLKTYDGIMAALEEAFDLASSGIEKAQIVQFATAINRENEMSGFAQTKHAALQSALRSN